MQNHYCFGKIPTGKLKSIFQRHNASYNTTLVLQCRIMQNNNGGTVQYWQRTQFKILVNLQKWYIHIFLVKMVVGILITLTRKINDCRQQSLIKIFAIRMANHPLHCFPYPQPIIIFSIANFVNDRPANAPPPKHFFTNSTHSIKESYNQLGWNTDNSGENQESYRLVVQLLCL